MGLDFYNCWLPSGSYFSLLLREMCSQHTVAGTQVTGSAPRRTGPGGKEGYSVFSRNFLASRKPTEELKHHFYHLDYNYASEARISCSHLGIGTGIGTDICSWYLILSMDTALKIYPSLLELLINALLLASCLIYICKTAFQESNKYSFAIFQNGK